MAISQMTPQIRELAFRAAEIAVKDPGLALDLMPQSLLAMAKYVLWASVVIDKIHHESHRAFYDQYGSGTAMGRD